MEIKTHRRMRKAKFAKNKVRVLLEQETFERAMYSLATNEVWGMITPKISVRGVAKRFPQKVSLRGKRRAVNRAILNHPEQLAPHILETSSTGKDLPVHKWCQFQEPVRLLIAIALM